MLNILLIEDNRDLAWSLIDHLEFENYICDYAPNGNEGMALIEKSNYNVIILDVNMPGMDGLSLCEELRAYGNDTPILMLTARDTLENKLQGFEAGADDYLVKPFEIKELVVRLGVLAKRRSGQVSTLDVGPLSLNLKNQSGHLNNTPIKLTPTLFKLLETLLRESPNPVPHEEMVKAIWGDTLPDSNKLRVHIHKLRKLLSHGNAGHLLKTIPGYGFCFTE